MATRTVRLDASDEAALQEIRSATGLPISEAIKQGIQVLRERVRENPRATFYDFYRTLTITSGDARGPARDSRRAVREAVAEKLRRRKMKAR